MMIWSPGSWYLLVPELGAKCLSECGSIPWRKFLGFDSPHSSSLDASYRVVDGCSNWVGVKL